ncbi:MAG: tripartite tricarboxylate transporter substrate binding protein [Pseudomonadota bacterium]
MKFFPAVAQLVTAALLMALTGGVVAQQAYPNKTIRLIVPFPPGGGVTIIARLIAPKLMEGLGQPVIVDNRPGGNTIIGTEAVAKAAPDGYTLLMISSAHVINHFTLPNLPYDSFKDFAPVATSYKSRYILIAHPSLPANNLREFIAPAKARPGQLNYSSSGTGGVQHLAGELFSVTAGVKIEHIPYKGGGPAITDLLGGQVEFSFQPLSTVFIHVKAGRLKALAVPDEVRAPLLPQVPTFAEAGLPGFHVSSWGGVLAPARTPRAIIDKLSAEIGRILATPDMQKQLVNQGQEALISTPEQFASMMKEEMTKIAALVKVVHIKPRQH